MKLAVSYILPGQEAGNSGQVLAMPVTGPERFSIERSPVEIGNTAVLLISALYTEHNHRLSMVIEHDGVDVLNAACGYISEKVSILFRLKDGTVINLLFGKTF